MKNVKKFLSLFFGLYAVLGTVFVLAFVVIAIYMGDPMALIGAGVGLIFLLIGVIALLFMGKSKRSKKHLIETGYQIWATVIDVQKNTSFRVNGRCADKLICKGTDLNGNPCIYTSENLFTDQVYLAQGQNVPVYISRENPDKYYVDVRTFTREKL